MGVDVYRDDSDTDMMSRLTVSICHLRVSRRSLQLHGEVIYTRHSLWPHEQQYLYTRREAQKESAHPPTHLHDDAPAATLPSLITPAAVPLQS